MSRLGIDLEARFKVGQQQHAALQKRFNDLSASAQADQAKAQANEAALKGENAAAFAYINRIKAANSAPPTNMPTQVSVTNQRSWRIVLYSCMHSFIHLFIRVVPQAVIGIYCTMSVPVWSIQHIFYPYSKSTLEAV